MARQEKPSDLPALRYREISAHIRRHLEALAPGERVPSTTFWRLKFGVSRTTVNRAFDELKRSGLLSTRVGSGTVRSAPARVRTILVLWKRTAARGHTQFGGEFLTGASLAAERQGDILVAHANAEGLGQGGELRHDFPGLAGVLFFRAPELAAQMGASLNAQGIPWLLYGSSAYARVTRGLAVDEAKVAAVALEALVSVGRRRIGMLWRGDHPPGFARREAWEAWMREHGFPVDPSWAAPIDRVLAPGATRELRAWLEPLEAVFCATDGEALALLEAARPMGMRIPEHLSIIGVDNNPLIDRLNPPLASVEIPVEAHGAAALCRLLGAKEPRVLRDARVIVRQSLSSKLPDPIPSPRSAP
jgi:DNA-binding LacI/PurR family transcriptional regulator